VVSRARVNREALVLEGGILKKQNGLFWEEENE
jgi:hypothetical protein